MMTLMRVGLLTGLFFLCALFSLRTARADNFLLNPSFETHGTLTYSCGAGCSYSAEGNSYGNCCATDSTTIPNWTISAFTQAAGVEVPGGTALEPLPDGLAAAFTSGGSISQTVSETMVAGDTYTLYAWVANYSGGTYNMFVQSASVYGSSSTLFGASATGVTEGIWTQLSGTFTAPSSDSGDPMTVILFNQGGAGQAQFDDVCLTNTTCSSDPSPVPEPNSIFLLLTAVVGVAFKLRRLLHA